MHIQQGATWDPLVSFLLEVRPNGDTTCGTLRTMTCHRCPKKCGKYKSKRVFSPCPLHFEDMWASTWATTWATAQTGPTWGQVAALSQVDPGWAEVGACWPKLSPSGAQVEPMLRKFRIEHGRCFADMQNMQNMQITRGETTTSRGRTCMILYVYYVMCTCTTLCCMNTHIYLKWLQVCA